MCVPKEQDERTMPRPLTLGTPDASEPRARLMRPRRSRAGGAVDTLAESPCPGHPQIP